MAFKPNDGVETKRYLVTLDEETVNTARKIGDGNLSLGLRLAVRGETSAPAATQRYVPRAALPEDEKEVLRAAEKRKRDLRARGYYEEGGEYLSTEGLRVSLTALRKLKEEFGPAR